MPRKASEVDQMMDLLFAGFKRSPWWAGLIAIPLTFLLFYPIIPLLAFIATVVVTLVWLIALLHKFTDNQRLDRQRGIDTIRELNWREFEQLLATAFERQGYTVTDTGLTHGTGSPDGGIDLILKKDGRRFLVQCKQWKARKVGVKIARELYGLVASEHANGGILVTSGRYTQEAKQFAKKLPLKLIDGPKLEALIQGVQRTPAARPEPRPRTDSTGTTASTRSVPNCPKCQSPMLHKIAKRGAKAGQTFWGCPNFPNCRGTRSM